MMVRRMFLGHPLCAALLALAACATANSGDGIDSGTVIIDAQSLQPDTAQPVDARPGPDGGMTDARMIDASPITPDGGCTPTTTQILMNPAFDSTPIGSDWVTAPFDPTLPLITAEDGVVEHTAPNKAWLGGVDGDLFGDAIDTMYQQVTVPAGTTMLTVRGMYQVRTGETGGSIYDTGRVELLTTTNALLETVLSVSNVTPTTVWTSFQRTFNSPYAGQAVRLRFRSASDDSNETSFYFDSIVLEAQVTCP